MKYRDGMDLDEVNALLAECQWLDDCYAEAAIGEALPENDEDFNPIQDGWVGKDGRP